MPDTKIDIALVGKFDGKNYHQWKFQMCCALRAKGLFEIVKGIEGKPLATGDVQKKWIKEDAYAMFLLTSTMDYSQITLIENCQSSKQIMDKLDAIYEQKTEMNKMLAHGRFSQYKMNSNNSIAYCKG
ncbi:copia [Lasius niger]|uniref:Copia n=1 Tax=Lasius niger TaxID=67767 RepID=A0A0J7N812_LASNI|nr:copia [Lasius niger]